MEMGSLGLLEQESFRPTVIPEIYTINLSAPISIQYEVVAECNQRCIFCYNVWKTQNCPSLDTLSQEKRMRVVEKIIEADVFEVILSGGEPLLAPELCNLVLKLAESNIRVYLITNRTLLTKEIAYRLKESGLKGLQISLHASEEKIHESITRLTGSCNQTLRGLRNALDAFTPELVSVNMVLIKRNLGEIKPLLKRLKGLGVSNFALGFLSQTGLASSFVTEKVSKEEIETTFKTLWNMGEAEGVTVGVSGGFPFCIFPKDEQEYALKLASNVCDAGLNQLVVSPAGEIRPCVCLPQILGNILADDLREIWVNAPFLQFLRALKHVPVKCHECDLVALCKGGCRASVFCLTGNFEEIELIK